jgi:ABC-type branched-subunit amino acid transport system ATPase component
VMSGPENTEGLRLHVDAVQAGYGPVTIIRDMTLRLPAGTITALLGPNGAGKSTTCKAIVGLVPTKEGRILLNGEDLCGHPCWWRAQRGVFLAPEGRGIFPGLSVEDNLKVSVRSASDRERIYERFSNLADRRQLHAGSLSGGEQQMLTLAPTLTEQPEVLIVDEPTLGLAPRVAEFILDLFAELKEGGATILLVGESPHGLVDIADAVTLVHGGRVVWSGTPSDLSPETLEHAYFSDQRTVPSATYGLATGTA